MEERPGTVVLFGSGETSASGRRVYDWLFSRLPQPLRVAVLETPAGFQPNSEIVAGKVAEYLRGHLQNFRPRLSVIPARRRGTDLGPDNPELARGLLNAEAVFLGPGSPTYAVRQLKNSLLWEYLVARQRLGSAVIFASAAAVAAGRHAIPVYEIYKAGSELHWQPGLDIFGPYGFSLLFVPHWNNNEGGAELDTSHCFVGKERFERLLGLLAEKVTIIGIDEHTALIMDFEAGCCRVMGRSGVTLLHAEGETRFGSGQSFPLSELGAFRLPAPGEGLSREVWPAALESRDRALRHPEGKLRSNGLPPELLVLAKEREAARACRDWAASDELRRRIADLGWQVVDTPEGPRYSPISRTEC